MRPLPGAPSGGPTAVLTAEQQASYQKNMADKRAEMMELSSKRQAARMEINQIVLSPKFDENLIRQKIMDEAKIEADLAILQARAFADIQPPLTDEQMEKLKQSQAPRQPMMMRPTQTPPTAPTPPGTNHDASGLPPKQ
jgi:Spy/CpxP family protein refolding chaperone